MQTIRPMVRIAVRIALMAVALCVFAAAPAAAQDLKVKGQTLYVPVYSHIYSGDRERPTYLAATISIRNTDPAHAIQLEAVDYFDSEGRRVRRYIENPISLKPMASTRYVVSESDKAGGSGANFIVRWKSDQPVNPPIAEGIMISTASQLGISFTSRGQVIQE